MLSRNNFRYIFLTLGILCAVSSAFGFDIREKRKGARNRPVVYDTIHVIVRDTIRVHEQKNLEKEVEEIVLHTPHEVDSLIFEWRKIMTRDAYDRSLEMYSREIYTDSPSIDTLYSRRLKDIMSPIQLPYNSLIGRYINIYTNPANNYIKDILARSQHYLPMVEEELIKEGLPEELSALPIIESAYSSQITSRAGAVGLWQLMPSTAKNLGLEVNSMVDERCDPVRATQAACKFLKYLHRVYGDWGLVLAAYNYGPGNINRAQNYVEENSRNFWNIYPVLPHETREYVPKFIAALYISKYYKIHNIRLPKTPEYIATDTVTISRPLHLEQISTTIGISLETLRFLNPQYKLDIIPATRKDYKLTLPVTCITDFYEKRDSIFAKDSLYLKEYINPANIDAKKIQQVGYTYVVKKGDNLSLIAKRNGTTTANIMKWNHLKSSSIRIGQKLRINRPKPRK